MGQGKDQAQVREIREEVEKLCLSDVTLWLLGVYVFCSFLQSNYSIAVEIMRLNRGNRMGNMDTGSC
jgi:hypothetical protein